MVNRGERSPSKDHPREGMWATIAAEFGASRGWAGIGVLKGELGPYGRQHASGQWPTEKDPKLCGHGLEAWPFFAAPVAASVSEHAPATSASASSDRGTAAGRRPRPLLSTRFSARFPGHAGVDHAQLGGVDRNAHQFVVGSAFGLDEF